VSVPPKLAISDLVRLMKGRSSHKVQREFPQIKKTQLGLPVLGPGVLFNHQRCHHRGHRTSVFGTTHR
jgi:REP element-mobilizing transposase RayT